MKKLILLPLLFLSFAYAQVSDGIINQYHPWLLKITQALLADLASIYSQVEWTAFSGLSVRTLSRHFLDETGMSFSRWKTLARVIDSLEKLFTGESVANVAFSLGYENPSAFIAVFKDIIGVTLGTYFSHS